MGYTLIFFTMFFIAVSLVTPEGPNPPSVKGTLAAL